MSDAKSTADAAKVPHVTNCPTLVVLVNQCLVGDLH